MSAENLERRIVQMLCCDPNRPVLEQVVENECNVDFRYVASEFPILMEGCYGFLDIVGKDERRNSIALIECKPRRSLLSKAAEEVEYYRTCLDLYGLFQNRDLIGLYHRAIFNESFNSKLAFDVRPLILDQHNLSKYTDLSFTELFHRYRMFMFEWFSSNYRISSQDIARSIPKDTVPLYLINRLENQNRKSYIAFYGLRRALHFTKLDNSIVDAATKLEPDQTKYETLRRIENSESSENRFSVQFHMYGHSRPMLFFEIDDTYSACFLHTGRHQVELIGYYDSAHVLDKTRKIYGLIEAEAGSYAVVGSRRSRVTIELAGERCSGEIKLNFLDRVYLDENVELASSRQTTLHHH